MKSMRTRLLTLAAFAACVAACGPTIPIVAGLKEAGADIFFGRPAPSPAPIPLNIPIQAVFPPPILPVPNVPIPTFQPRCPTASPLSFPAHEAAETPPGPPAAGTYEYRYKGAILKNPGTSTQVTQIAIDTVGSRTIDQPVKDAANGSYTFNVVEKIGPLTETNSYTVFPQSVAATALPAGVNPDNGIYLSAMQLYTLGSSNTFRPVTPIELMTLPATNGPMALRGSGSDGSTTMTITPNNQGPAQVNGNAPTPLPTSQPNDTENSYNAGRVTVDACGKVLQGWKVLLTGSISSTAPGSVPNQTFKIEQDYGTQYGGFSLHDVLEFDWTDAASQAPMQEQLEATIDQEPKLAS